jgi:hypothetical protein
MSSGPVRRQIYFYFNFLYRFSSFPPLNLMPRPSETPLPLFHCAPVLIFVFLIFLFFMVSNKWFVVGTTVHLSSNRICICSTFKTYTLFTKFNEVFYTEEGYYINKLCQNAWSTFHIENPTRCHIVPKFYFIFIWNKILTHCGISSDFLYELCYDARIHRLEVQCSKSV